MRLIRPLLIAVLALFLVPLSATPAQAADGTISGVATDSSGKPLRNVGWEVYTWKGGEWTTLQFGPKITDSKGRFSYTRAAVGGKYRVCFHDTFYGELGSGNFWQPEVRHQDRCWPNASSYQSATTWTSSTKTPSKTFTVKLPRQGLGMAPVDPFIVGSFNLGDPLTIVGQEGWRPTGATFTYQWMSQGSPIAGATSATFTPTAAQNGTWIRARVTASRSGYKPATLTTQSTMIGTAHVQPSSPLKITGTAKPGSTLTASFGKPANTYSEVSWFVDGVPQPRSTAYNSATSHFTVSAAHSGARIDARLKIYRTDPSTGNYVDGSDAFQRALVQVGGSRPAQAMPAAAAPAGTPTVGRLLAAPKVTADPKAKVTYQWVRGTSSIAGATTNRYRVRTADVNKTLRVRATVTRPGWPTQFVRTTSAKVAKRPIKTGSVKVVGKAKVGKRLTARTAGWKPKSVKVRYRWLRNGHAIRGANQAHYKVRKADRRKVIRVRVTVSKKNYLTVSKTSKGTRVKR